MNILILSNPIFFEEQGGSNRVVFDIVNRLSQRGHNITIISPKDNLSLSDHQIVKENIEIFRYNYSKNFIYKPFHKTYSCFRLFSSIIKEKNFDLINIHFAFAGLGIFLNPISKKIPIVFTFHGPWALEENKRTRKQETRSKKQDIGYKIRNSIEKYVLDKSNRIIVLSEYSKKQLIEIHKIKSDKIKIIPAGVDTKYFKIEKSKEEIRSELLLPQDKIILLTIRRLVGRMGIDVLINSISDIISVYQNILLVIGGKGELESYLKKLVVERKLQDYVKFVGYIPDEQLPLYYGSADYFILPSQDLEGFGLVTLESLACGTPVLATKVGASPEILSKLSNDMLIDNKDSESISRSIIECLSNKRKIPSSKECREFIVDNYSWDKIISEWESFLIQTAQIYT